VSTSQNFNNITGLGNYFRVDGDDYAFLGKFMHIHVNLDFISRLLSDNIDTDGKISVYTFFEQLMQGIQDATGNINDYRIMYDELSNTFYISDNSTLPNADKLLGVSIIPTVINAHVLKDNLGSFVTNVSLKSDLNNNYATMISVGAQSNGNVVGENATAFSRWNVGYEDRIVKDRSSVIDKVTQESGSKSPEQVYVDNLLKYGMLNNLINSGQVTTDDITNNGQAVVDMLKYEIAYFTQNDNIQGQGFLPINLQLTMLGLSGPRLFESYTINETLLPDGYKNNIKFLTKGITHKIDTNGWSTTLDSFSGPRLDSLNKAVFYWPPEQEIAVNAATAGGGGGGAGTNANVKGCSTFSNYPDAPWTPSSVGSQKPASANPALLARRRQGIGNGDSSGMVSISSRGNINIITDESSLLYPAAADAFNKWADEISAAGLCFTVSSVFRTYAMQVAVAKKYANQPGKAATPGSSPHGDGIAIDIRELYRLVNGSTSGTANANARTTKQYRYISYVGAKYGWYNPARLQGGGRAECWHFEYWGNA
jgi:LAS superfamily LD-carboxypeptidase LdcB